nr:Patched domain containing protein [Haemonchus contortus]
METLLAPAQEIDDQRDDSVDYTAHVAYQFYRSRGTPQERLVCSLGEMAAPMVQAGLSTFLCMLPLIFVPTYAIVAFAKTIFIVVGIGKLILRI